jgi:hypothetical protein
MPIQHVATPRNKKIPLPSLKPQPEKIPLAKFLRLIRGSKDKEMSQWVRVTRVVNLRDKSGRKVLRCETVTEKPNTPPERGHYCSFRPVDPKYTGKLSKCPAIIYGCNCHRWLFVWEFAMWYHVAAQLLRSNGEYPEVTNPLLKTGGCKHLIVGAAAVMSKQL